MGHLAGRQAAHMCTLTHTHTHADTGTASSTSGLTHKLLPCFKGIVVFVL